MRLRSRPVVSMRLPRSTKASIAACAVRACHSDHRLDSRCIDHWDREELFRQPNDRVGPSLVEQLVAHVMLQLDEANRSFLGVTRLSAHSPEEERQPGHQVALLARDQQVVVVLAAVLLEVGREVEERLGGASRRTTTNEISNRLMRPLPSRNGWMTSNW